jgi:hypothetical protein
MTPAQRERLLSFREPLVNFHLYSIAPLHSVVKDARMLYEALGHAPVGSCGACNAQILATLYDHLVDEKLI